MKHHVPREPIMFEDCDENFNAKNVGIRSEKFPFA